MTHASSGDSFVGLDPSPQGVLDTLIADDWSMLTSLVDRIRNHQGSFGERVPPRRIDENRMAMGYCVTGELVGEASKFLYSHGFVLAGFDWAHWGHGRTLLSGENTSAISDLTAEETLGLITMIVRSDRFSEGALLRAFDSGTMPRLLAHLLDFADIAKNP